jgi:hypothetical protein
MYVCAACDITFVQFSKFVHHCVRIHGAARATVERVCSQHPRDVVVLVCRRRGGAYMMVNPPLL